ncbi:MULTISPECIES: aminotransferase-like domain-containing protein [unclassified Vibrio]|uniref:aminotransferase-like domain-containing protein n=1 Tax=unclassified Vibrio TaxID=2614977 RepID=UPI001361F1C3|nr:MULTISPECIES: PLP-dependent aminotransferase family protein [unclassified Vibrio]NAW56902.1 aminotransferase class I/II-fold pyridoxal phosphate-dependent enzyme [Vibrio sp. V36_P2S2PM302]NAX27594.1 aminotransferase class I/II-fold pyridoxal phosphate-dependent enzyme [Vibrio sp. V38_P2S17PM301]NAX32714.1 aminotransferase class I/II-fold pyridoxal phosphate-dependent enzyme [Vibrio sp. V37_P2S8PM304]
MDTPNKYLMVEYHLRQAIDGGLYRAEDKLPSIRQLSQTLNVGKNTVIRAYQELEAAGVVYAVEKSGYRVKSTPSPQIPQQPPRRVDLLSLSKEILTYREEKERLPLGSAHPNIDAPAIKSLYATIGRHSRLQSQMPSHYQLPPGHNLLLRQLVRISRDLGVPATLDDIAVTNGAQQAISLALRALTKPGDIVAVESPCYFGNLLLMESLGLQVVEIPGCVRTGMDPTALAKALKRWDIRAILVTPNFANPTGARMPLEKRLALLDASSGIPIIEDDVFGALAFDEGIAPLAALASDERVIYVNSLSKTLDSRLRLGWLIAGCYQPEIEKLLICENMGSQNLIQSAAAEFLTTGKYRQHINKMRRTYQHNQRRLHQQLSDALNRYSNLHKRFYLTQPDGGYLSWLLIDGEFDSEALYRACHEHKISLLPGTVFATSDGFRNALRLSCAHYRDERHWQQGIDKLARLISEYCGTKHTG